MAINGDTPTGNVFDMRCVTHAERKCRLCFHPKPKGDGMKKLGYRLTLIVLWPWVIPIVFIRAAVGAFLLAQAGFATQWMEDWREVGFKHALKAFKKGERL